jgi:hypothetical protein
MSRRRRKTKAQEPSLVPLADMLTNTVGIMLFILAFTLLGTGGATVLKRLPMEQETDAKPLYFLCLADRILPVDFKDTDRLPQPSPGRMDVDDARDFVRRGNGAEIENEFFKIRQTARLIYANGRPSRIVASAEYFPKRDAGVPKQDLLRTNLAFIESLNRNSTNQTFLYFLVQPEGMNLFFKAREIGASHGFRSGWGPLGPTNNVVVGIIGGGGGNIPKPE